jgi:hypothetical protein
MADNLWLDEGLPGQPRTARPRRTGIVVAAVICLVVVAVPVALVVSGGSDWRGADAKAGHTDRPGHGRSAPAVLGALNATTDSGNFDVSYTFGGQSGEASTTTTTGCGGPGVSPGTAPHPSVGSEAGTASSYPVLCMGASPAASQPVTGTATIDLEPFAMVATSKVSGLGTVVLRDNGTDVWEEGGGNYGLTPGANASGPGSSLTGFAGLVEGTLGPRQGPLAMLGLASPTGYLNLDPAETSSADLVGTDTVDGVPVEVYQITQSPAQVAQIPGLTDQEQQAVAAAMQLLSQQGYTGSTVRVSVDPAGFIRRTQTTDHFSDGTTMTSEAEFSDFGCAGTVLMPGQSGSSTPPTGCTSPDDPTATTGPPTTVPPTTAPGSGPTTTAPATTPTTSASAPATTTGSTATPDSTSVPSSTTSTTAHR